MAEKRLFFDLNFRCSVPGSTDFGETFVFFGLSSAHRQNIILFFHVPSYCSGTEWNFTMVSQSLCSKGPSGGLIVIDTLQTLSRAHGLGPQTVTLLKKWTCQTATMIIEVGNFVAHNNCPLQTLSKSILFFLLGRERATWISQLAWKGLDKLKRYTNIWTKYPVALVFFGTHLWPLGRWHLNLDFTNVIWNNNENSMANTKQRWLVDFCYRGEGGRRGKHNNNFFFTDPCIKFTIPGRKKLFSFHYY